MTMLTWAFPTFLRGYRWWRDRLSIAGKALVIAIAWQLLSAIRADVDRAPLLPALVSVFVVSWMANRVFWPRLRVRVRGPAQAMCGQAVAIEYEATNASWLPAYNVRLKAATDPSLWQVAESEAIRAEIASRATVLLAAAVRPQRRGVWRWPGVDASSSFPFNLWRTQQSFPAATEVVVYPSYDPDRVREIEHALARHAGLNSFHASRATAGSDFFANREYQLGMPVQRWNYGAWARLGQPIVREFQEPHGRRAVVYVDMDLAGEELEEMLSNTAALCDYLLAEQWSLDFVVLGATLHSGELEPIGLADVLDALARATRSNAPPDAGWTSRLSSDHAVFLLLARWDQKHEAMFRSVAENCGHVVAMRLQQGRLILSPARTDDPALTSSGAGP